MYCYECGRKFDNEEDTGVAKITGYGGKVYYEGPLICNACCEKYAGGLYKSTSGVIAAPRQESV